jgi:hypothetical protein
LPRATSARPDPERASGSAARSRAHALIDFEDPVGHVEGEADQRESPSGSRFARGMAAMPSATTIT